MLKIIYISICALIGTALLVAILTSIRDNTSMLTTLYVMFFYILGVTLGVMFLGVNIIIFWKTRNPGFFGITILCLLWVFFSIANWVYTGVVFGKK
jgi:hypothetical protein